MTPSTPRALRWMSFLVVLTLILPPPALFASSPAHSSNAEAETSSLNISPLQSLDRPTLASNDPLAPAETLADASHITSSAIPALRFYLPAAPVTHRQTAAVALPLEAPTSTQQSLLDPSTMLRASTATTTTLLEPTPTPEPPSNDVVTSTNAYEDAGFEGADVTSLQQSSGITFTRGYSDLVASYYNNTDLTGFVLSRAWAAPIDFYQSCVGESSPYAGCKLINELDDGEGYTVQWQGSLLVPASGTYTFSLTNVDDGARIFLNGSLLVDKGWNWPSPDTKPSPQSISLISATYPITIEYMQRPAFVVSLQIRWAGPGLAEEVIPQAYQFLPIGQTYSKTECPVCGNDEKQNFTGDPINTIPAITTTRPRICPFLRWASPCVSSGPTTACRSAARSCTPYHWVTAGYTTTTSV